MILLRQLKSFIIPEIIFKTKSKINGEIKVVQFLGRRSIQVGSLQQSGDLVANIWQKGIKEIKKPACRTGRLRNEEIKEILILGLGGGSILRIINKYFPRAEITALEIDPKMVEIGRRYFALKNFPNLRIRVEDAFSYLAKNRLKFDLILVDLYLGSQIPQKLKTEKFINDLKKSLRRNGVVIFNHIRSKTQKKELTSFHDLLKKKFKTVRIISPLINSLFICY